MFRIILIIFLFFEIISYDKASFEVYKHSLSICKECIPYRLKVSPDENIVISIPSLYNSSNSRIGNENNFTLAKIENDEFVSLLENYNLYSVMGYYIDKDNKYYILDQGKISENGYKVDKDTPKLILYNPNDGKIVEYKFEGIDLTSSILTDVIVDHEGKYAYITDSGNLNLTNEKSNSGIIVLKLDSRKVYRILNNHSSFKADTNINLQKPLTNNTVNNFISEAVGVNNIQISCNDKTIFYSSLRSNNIYSVSTKDILKAIEKYDKSQNLNDLNKFRNKKYRCIFLSRWGFILF